MTELQRGGHVSLVHLVDGLLWGIASLLAFIAVFLLALITVAIAVTAISSKLGTVLVGWDPVSLMRHPPGWAIAVGVLLLGVFSLGFRHGLRRSRRLHGAAQ